MRYNDFKKRMKPFPLFSSAMLPNVTERVGTLKVQLAVWKKKGLVVPLRKGLYVLNQEDRQIEPPNFYLANQIFIPSYVSLESALSYYGFIPEFVSVTTSVTVRKTCEFKNEFGVFIYQHVKPEAYGGFRSVQETEKMSFLMATPEKAVVDFIYLNLEQFHLKDGAVFVRSYRFQNCERLNPKKLRSYAQAFKMKKLSKVTQLFIATCLR